MDNKLKGAIAALILAGVISSVLVLTPQGELQENVSAERMWAISTGHNISRALGDLSLPFDQEFTFGQLTALGYDTANMTRKGGTYRVLIKNISFDSTTGLLSVDWHGWYDNQQLVTHSPTHWYLPIEVPGNTNDELIVEYIFILVSTMEILPFGDPVGDDASSIYPCDFCDGWARENTDQSFALMKADVGDAFANTADIIGPRLTSTTTSDQYSYMDRSVISFDTSVIPDTAIISAADVKTTVFNRAVLFGWDGNMYLYSGTMADVTQVQATDYDSYGGTAYSAAVACPASGALDFTGNAAFIAEVQDKIHAGDTVVTYQRDSFDVGTDTPTWASATSNQCRLNHVGDVDVGDRPFLYATYTTVVTPVAAFSFDKTFCYVPCSVTATDASTNTPTSWDYDWGDGSTHSTTQNPSHIYTRPGEYTVDQTATNAAGSDHEIKTDYVLVRMRY